MPGFARHFLLLLGNTHPGDALGQRALVAGLCSIAHIGDRLRTEQATHKMSESQLSPEDLPYRPCVGVMLFNRDGLVFVGRRIDQTIEGWQMPQGGIDEGETPRQAASRELQEEIGTDKAVILREHSQWLTYDLPRHLLGVALHGKYRGQRQKWFAMRFSGTDADINIATTEPEFAHWKWQSIEALPQLIVPFKRDTYAKVISEFQDLATASG